MKIFFCLLLTCVSLSAQEKLYLSCAVEPVEQSREFLGAKLGALDRLWTCGVHNGGLQERVVEEADVVMSLHALGVPAIRTSSLVRSFHRARYRGFLLTLARILRHGNDVVVSGTAMDVIKPGPTGAAFIGLGAFILPLIPPALQARSPSGDEIGQLRTREPLGVKPGASVLLSVWSGPYRGPEIVRGYVRQLIAPVAVAAEPVEETAKENLLRPKFSSRRCSHVLPCFRASTHRVLEQGWWAR